MSGLYGKTTESVESLEQTTSCATRFTSLTDQCHPSKSKKKKTATTEETKFNVKIDSPQSEEMEEIEAQGSNEDFDSNLHVDEATGKKPNFGRSKSMRQSIAHGTLEFFGLQKDEDEQDRTQRKWNERRVRLISRMGKIRSDHQIHRTDSTLDRADGTVKPGLATYVSQMMDGRSSLGNIYGLQPGKLKRESAASILWKTASKKMSTRTPDEGALQTFAGRSFAPCDLTDIDEDESVFGSQFFQSLPRSSPLTPIATPSATLPLPSGGYLDPFAFFQFQDSGATETMEYIEEEGKDIVDGATPAMSPYTPSARMYDGWDTHRRQVEMEKLRAIARGFKVPVRTNSVMSDSERRGRLKKKPVIRKKHMKRQFGKGLVGDLLNRTFKRSRIDSNIKQQMEDIPDHRPFFTYWISFVQIIIIIVTVSIYKFAPVGVAKSTKEKKVLYNRNGVLNHEMIEKVVVDSFWIGPSLSTLILLGAKYAPCMRKDTRLYRKVSKERKAENSTGCCISSQNTGCIQREQKECTSSFTKFYPGKVCENNPRTCLNPRSGGDFTWGPTITDWPICKKKDNLTKFAKDKFPEMHCYNTGHPCCIGTQSKCIITNQEHCHYLDGVFHKTATLCSQVDCLLSTCGLLPFAKDDVPDQFYRLWLSLFLHAGLLHVIITLIFNFTILRDIEKMAGWIRISIIFMFSGIGGNLWSAILIPYQAEVGPSGALFGMMACLFAELIQSWQIVERPFKAMAKLAGVMLVLFIFGLLPYIDNFAHIFGFLYGFFLALIFLPSVEIDAFDRKRKKLQLVLSVIILVILTVTGFLLFYVKQEFSTSGIGYMNCIPITDDFCLNSHTSQELER